MTCYKNKQRKYNFLRENYTVREHNVLKLYFKKQADNQSLTSMDSNFKLEVHKVQSGNRTNTSIGTTPKEHYVLPS